MKCNALPLFWLISLLAISHMKKSIQELEKKAVLWWTEELKSQNANASIIPKLLESQDDFLKILSLGKKDPEHVFELLRASKFPANLFVKHLTVLSDYGGESLQRLGRSFKEIFPQKNNQYFLPYTWQGKNYTYLFQSLPISGLGNKKLKIDGEGLQTEMALTPLLYDVAMILLHAATSEVAEQAGLEKCEIGGLIGDDLALEKYVKQKYILVSRITGGATANNLGQLAQTEIFNYLTKHLDSTYSVIRNGKVILKEYPKEGGMPFDIVVEKNNKKIGIEVSFQVTTNSTIERKAGQAESRQNLMHSEQNFIAYVIDGAGNFQRRSAVSTICKFSDCTVAYSPSEFQILVNWIKEVI